MKRMVKDTVTGKLWLDILCEVDDFNNWITPDKNLGKVVFKVVKREH